MKYIVNDNQIGYLIKKGTFVKTLAPGQYRYSTRLGYEVKITEARGEVNTFSIPVKKLMCDDYFSKHVVNKNISNGTFAFVTADEHPVACITGKRLLWWKSMEDIEVWEYETDSPEMPTDIPVEFLAVMTPETASRLTVPVGSVSMLYYDKKFVKELEPGVYWFWKNGVDITQRQVNVTKQLLDINHQELLTADKVTVRITMAIEYTITEPKVFAETLTNGEEQLRLCAQLALRDYVGGMKLEELLDKKGEFSGFLMDRLSKSECALWCSIGSAGIKDVIIPGEIRQIMNTVLMAEKQAQASVITRREEVASTRSLLNTAKLMEDNPTLMRLKELEYLERICDRVDSISVSGNADLLEQLSKLCRSEKK